MRRFSYSVSEGQVAEFVSGNRVVQEFLNKYEKDGVSYGEKAVALTRFFRWLKIAKGLVLGPEEFLDLHLKKRNLQSIGERRWALSLALEYSRDNPDLKECAMQYRYSAFFLPIKLFCDANEVPLTTNNGFFPRRGRRKYEDRPFTVEFVKRILGFLSERDRAVCLVQLQSGQNIKQVLVDINSQARYVFREIDAGKKRIKFEFKERKCNGFHYFSFISVDAIQQLQKWRVIRGSGEDHKLDVVGGVYDAAPSVYPDVVEKEYAKLEPYLNIYNVRRGSGEEALRDKFTGLLIEYFSENPKKQEKFFEMLRSL